VGGDEYKCTGIPFDFIANEFSDGWVCAAIEAKDLLGTRGVSKPLRVYFDSTLLGYLKGNMASGTLPHCTGTLDKNTGQVNTTECKFRPELPLAPHPTVTKFPQLFFGPFVREGA